MPPCFSSQSHRLTGDLTSLSEPPSPTEAQRLLGHCVDVAAERIYYLTSLDLHPEQPSARYSKTLTQILRAVRR